MQPYICNGNRAEWSPIRSVIIRVINKIRRPRSGSPICLIKSMITDRIGQHEVLLPINHNFNKIYYIIGLKGLQFFPLLSNVSKQVTKAKTMTISFSL